MAWRTIDGKTLDPLGQFNELETLIHGVLAPVYLLDFLRFFVLFEDDGTLVAIKRVVLSGIPKARARALP